MTHLSTFTRTQLKDRIRGCLFGSAVGDGYGLATEFMTTKTAVHLYGNGPIAFGQEPGYPVWVDDHRSMADRNDFTDDTDQMLLVLQSLEQTRDERLHPTNFAGRLLEWAEFGIPEIGTDPARGLGFTVGRVMDHTDFLSNPHRAAFEVWDSNGRDLAPNGAVMRTAVLGIESFWDECRVVENSMAAAKVTHADPRSVISALLSSVLISRLLRGGGYDASRDRTVVWNTKLPNPAYRQELLTYLERGTDLRGNHSSDPRYDPETPASQFQPKDYDALEGQRLADEAKVGGSYKSQFANHDPLLANMDRPHVVLRADIGWAGIDQVGEDQAMGALARSVMVDYRFLLYETRVAPPTIEAGQRVQDRWVMELETHCFPQNMQQIDLGNYRRMGYAFKCIGIGYYGATRAVDPSPTSLDYSGPAGLFRGLMEEVTLEGGDADTNDAVLGSLLGARFGLENGIPLGWWTGLQHLEWLDKTIDKYAERVLDSFVAEPR